MLKNRKVKKVMLTTMPLLIVASLFLPIGGQMTQASAMSNTYVIHRGDTLTGIAKKYHLSIAQLKEANRLSSDVIIAGKKLIIPAPSVSAPKQTVANSTPNSVYNPKVPMKREYQEYLYKLTKQRGLDYKKALAVIKTESTFNPNARSDSSFGLFQINKSNHASLAKKLNTANKPFDPYINMNWGTYMLSDLYNYWKGRGLTGTKLDQYVWSSYNRGLNAVIKYGTQPSYVNQMNVSVHYINSLFK